MERKADEKALRLIRYLEEVTAMRSKVVRLIEDYQSVLWLDDIPHEKGCFTHAWGPSDKEPDIWVEVTKQEEPKLTDVPEECEEWIDDPQSLYDTSRIPGLRESITVVETFSGEQEGDESEEVEIERIEYLEKMPQISELWKEYVESEWKPWAERHKRWQKVQNVYSKLFTIHQEQLKLGEEYEFVLGIGLLLWKLPNGQVVKRHLITAKASLHFEAHLGRFVVGPQEVGEHLCLETDMLDIQNIPLQAVEPAENKLDTTEGNPWDNSTIMIVLHALANSLSLDGTGAYHETEFRAPSFPENRLAVFYAPALISRKRSLRGLQQLLMKIRSHVDGGGDVPPEFSDLAEGARGRRQATDSTDKPGKEAGSELPEEIYFPASTNAEQLSIVNRLDHSTGVVVQGPPGTGKSHTIGNLIAHLLASGDRLLVTAKTPRALKVLQEKIHEKIRPLCINFIGDTSDERHSLEQSVQAVLAKHDSWNQDDQNRKLSELEQGLEDLKRERARLEHRIGSIREKDTKTQSLIDGMYVGTAARIAERIGKESAHYGWFHDAVEYDTQFDLDVDLLRKLHRQLKELPNRDASNCQQTLPVVGDDVPSVTELEGLIEEETELKRLTDVAYDPKNADNLHLLASADRRFIRALLANLESLKCGVENIKRRPMPWIDSAVTDMLSDNDTPWKELYDVTSESLLGLRARAREVSEESFDIPSGVETRKVIEDAKTVMTNLAMRGRLKGLFFTPKSMKERRYIYEDVRVNGSLCTSQGKLRKLLKILEVIRDIDYVWDMWKGKADRKPGPLPLQVAQQEELCEALGQVVKIYELLESAKKSVASISGLAEPKWHEPGSLDALIVLCRTLFAGNDLMQVQGKIKEYEGRLSLVAMARDGNTIAARLLSCIETRDAVQYAHCVQELDALLAERERIEWIKSTISLLEGKVPILTQELKNTATDKIWPSRLNTLESAWNWRRVNHWLENYIDEDHLELCESRLNDLDVEIRETRALIAEIQAWTFCLTRMTDTHRRSLVGWEAAVRRLGKGTGKYVSQYRKDAQKHLRKCHDAIPAWIMPLHRVYETVDAVPGLFDTIIVDEASQCGLEALPLTFLCKRLLVVGDDEQISPDAVGYNIGAVHRLMRKYLYDFEYPDSFHVASSLFDHAKLRFGMGKIVLREHFRCMPEIIRFSNDLCYSKTPLIPLRQYPPKRLAPIKSTQVTSGHKEGATGNAINRPEAEAIVERIVGMCHDEKYDGKTMGVIALLGHAQARLIEEVLLKEIGPEEYQSRNIICGGPYSFQGDERDIIFLSMVIAPNAPIGVLAKDDHRRRLNVAASRAKDQMWLFHSVTPEMLSTKCYRRKLLEFFLNGGADILTESLGEQAQTLRTKANTANRTLEKPPKPFDSWFEVDVILDIASKGYRVIPQYEFAGKRIDIVVEGQRAKLAVECYGDFWHGPDKYEEDNIRKRQLERCGWVFHIVRECEYYANPIAAVDKVLQKCALMGIQPASIETEVSEAPKATGFNEETDSESEEEFNDSSEEHAGRDEVRPVDAHAALRLKPAYLRSAIVRVLKRRPNYSCVLEKLPGYILKEWDIRTRGAPRQRFAGKVKRSAKSLDATGRVEIYKSKNVRIKLVTTGR